MSNKVAGVKKPENQEKSTEVSDVIESYKSVEQDSLPEIDINDKRYAKLGWFVLMLTFIVFGGWAALAPLNSAAVAVGEVVVESSNKVVQHYEGGLVSEILVKEGDHVLKGETLIKLLPTKAQAELAMVKSQLDESYGLEARLIAEQLSAEAIEFPDELLSQLPDSQIDQVIKTQKSIFKARRDALNGELAIYTEKVNALSQQISGLESYVKTLDSRIQSYEIEIKDWQALYEEKFTDKTRLQQMKRELEALRGELSRNTSDIARLKVQISETNYQKIAAEQRYRKEVVSQLSDVQAKKVDLSYRKLVLEDKLKRVEIQSPADGLVKGLEVVTIGSVIRPGETIMEIVPQKDSFAVKVRVKTTDIDKVHIGLVTDVRFSAFSSQTTHVIEGKVVSVSADKFVDEKAGMEYFEAKILLTPAGIEQMREDDIFLLPGMPAEAMIKTGERSLLAYLVKPITDMFARSFTED